MKLNSLKFIKKLLPLFVFALIISSCTKEDIEEPTQQADPNVVAEISNRNDLGGFGEIAGLEDCECYGPFDDIDWENGDPAEIEAQIVAALETLTEEELNALFTPVCTETDFYPNACFAECNGVTDYDECDDEWGCPGDDFDAIDCYEIVFPVTGVFSDGTTVTFADYDELFNAIITAEEEPQFVYPFNVTDLEGNITTVNSEEEWTALGIDCFGIVGGDWGDVGNPKEACFVEQFPITLIIDGTATTFQTEEEFYEWFEDLLSDPNTPPDDLEIEQGYPIQLLHVESGVSYTANNDEEYFDLYTEHCD